jgi:hypothetical protein
VTRSATPPTATDAPTAVDSVTWGAKPPLAMPPSVRDAEAALHRVTQGATALGVMNAPAALLTSVTRGAVEAWWAHNLLIWGLLLASRYA